MGPKGTSRDYRSDRDWKEERSTKKQSRKGFTPGPPRPDLLPAGPQGRVSLTCQPERQDSKIILVGPTSTRLSNSSRWSNHQKIDLPVAVSSESRPETPRDLEVLPL